MRYWYNTEFIEDGKTIDLISIGIVAEDGREYYAISTEFDPYKANLWVMEDVIDHLPEMWSGKPLPVECKLRKQIADDLIHFCDPEKYGKPEFWGYYSAYDHVALCQLFGRMMDLPKGFPRYTNDIEQLCDSLGNPKLPEPSKGEHHALADARWIRQAWEFLQTIKER